MKKYLSMIFLFLLSIIIVGCNTVEEPKTKEDKQKVAKKTENDNTSIKLDEYIKKYKKIANDNKDLSYIEFGKLTNQGKNTYSLMLTSQNNIGLYVEVDKNKNVKNIKVAALSSALSDYPEEVGIAQESLIESVDNSLSENQQKAILKKTKATNTKLKDITEVYNLKNVQYTYHSSIENDSAIFEAKYK